MTGRAPSGLRTRILLRVLPAAGALLLALVALTAEVAKQDYHALRLAALERETDHRAREVAARLDAVAGALRALAGNPLIVNALVDARARETYLPLFFHDFRLANAESAPVRFFDHDRRLVAANTPGSAAPSEAGFVRAMDGGFHTQIDETGLIITAPVFYAQRPEGALQLRLDPDGLAQALAIAPREGRLILRVGEATLHDSAPHSAATGWVTHARAAPGYAPLTVEWRERARAAFAPLTELRRDLIVSTALALLALSAGVALATHFATRPLRAFIADLHDFSRARDLTRRAEASGAREFHDLADAFNAMMERLRLAVAPREDLTAEYVQRRRTEQALHASESANRAIVRTVRDAIVTTDAEGAVLTVNPAAEAMFGCAAEALIGRSVARVLAEPERPGLHLSDAARAGAAVECQGRRADGAAFPMEISVSALELSGERLYCVVFRDISERKRVDRMKSEFVSVVSHELRTPLTALSGSLRLLGAGALGALPAAAERTLEIADRNAQRLVKLVNDILDFEKISEGALRFELRETDLGALAAEAIEENRAYADSHGVVLRLERPAAPVRVQADPDRIMQAVANLLSNAIKYSPPGGEALIQVKARADGAAITVRDQGPGIPEDAQDKLFTRFYQVDGSDARARQGAGLGLSIAQAIVAAHGGRASVRSRPGEGAAFTILLPAEATRDDAAA